MRLPARGTDSIEEVQLELLGRARRVVAPGAKELSTPECRCLACWLTEALTGELRIAESRGERIPGPPENPDS